MNGEGELPATAIDRLVEEFVYLREGGEAPDLEELCRAHSPHGEVLRRRIEFALSVKLGARGMGKRSHDGPGIAAFQAPETLGDFRLVREIGRGGMGIVYEARQVSLDRTVALKLLPPHFLLRRESVERFRREASMASRLHHPGIVPIHSVGEDHGIHYFAMDLVEGAALDAVIGVLRERTVDALSGEAFRRAVETRIQTGGQSDRQGQAGGGPPTSPEPGLWAGGYVEVVVRLVIQVCDALHHAHSHGIVHRDVKPSNILVQRDGTVVVTDFGLASQEGLPSLTVTGEFAGTPHYVSPEQASPERRKLDARTDVFSLGATLYELLTLRRPFDGRSSNEVLSRVTEAAPTRPRRLNGAIPRDLETIGLMALEGLPARRYGSTAAMADDLRRFLRHEPVVARPIAAPTRVLRWVRRRPARAASLALVCLLIVGLPLVASLYWNLKTQNDTNEKLERGRLMLTAGKLLETDPSLALSLAVLAADPGDLDPVSRRVLYQALCRAMAPGHEERVLTWDSGSVTCLSFSPDGSLLAAGDAHGRGALFEVPAGPGRHEWRLRKTLVTKQGEEVEGEIIQIAFRPDGRQLATSCLDGHVRLYESEDGNGRALKTFEGFNGSPGRDHRGSYLAFSPDGRKLAVARGHPPFVEVHDLTSDDAPARFPVGDSALCVQFWNDGSSVLVGSESGSVTLFGPAGDSASRELRPTGLYKVFDVLIGRDCVATVSPADGVDLFRQVEAGGHRTATYREARVKDATISDDGTRIVLGDKQGGVYVALLDDSAERAFELLAREPAAVNCVCFEGSSDVLATGSADGRVRVYEDAPDQEGERNPILTLCGHDAPIRSLACDRSGRWLASGSDDGVLRIWDLRADDSLVLSDGEGAVTGLSLVPGLQKVVVTRAESPTELRPIPAGKAASPAEFEAKAATREFVSEDGRYLLRARSSMDRPSGWEVLEASGASDEADSTERALAAFSPDGRWQVSGGLHGEINVRDAGTGRMIWKERRHGARITDLDFSGSIGLLLVTSEDSTGSVWNLQTGECLSTLCGHGSAVYSGALTEDGRVAVTGSGDHTVRIWRLDDELPFIVLRSHRENVMQVRISNDQRLVATGSVDGSVFLWEVDTGERIAALSDPTAVRGSPVTSIRFSPDDRMVLICSEEASPMLWDARNGELLAELEGQDGPVPRGEFDPMGNWVLTGSKNGVVRRWPVNPLAEARAQARALTAEEMWILLDKDSPLLERSGAEIEAEVQSARKQKEARGGQPDPYTLSNHAWAVVQYGHVSQAAYEMALDRAERAVHMVPRSPDFLSTLGGAYYRLGRYEEAEKRLREALALSEEMGTPVEPANLAFLALTLNERGSQNEASEHLEELEKLLKRSEHKRWGEMRLLRDEAKGKVAEDR